jgi:hypothetical protein
MLKTKNTVLLFCLINLSLLVCVEAKEKRPVLGWIENSRIIDTDIVLKSRIDTGAGLASIHADIVRVEKKKKGDADEVVVFDLEDTVGKKYRLNRPIVKWVSIKRKGVAGYIKRPVIKMKFCIGGKRIEGRVNLANRGRFLYPVLIGRNILKTGDFLVDPKKKFIHRQLCS